MTRPDEPTAGPSPKKIAANRSRISMNRLPRNSAPEDWPDNQRRAAKS
jgi:hypothetical protein